VTDASSGESSIQTVNLTVNLTVNAINDNPIVVNDNILIEENSTTRSEIPDQDIRSNTENNILTASQDIKSEPDNSSNTLTTKAPLPIAASIFSDPDNQSSSNDDAFIDDYKNKTSNNSHYVKPQRDINQWIDSQLNILEDIDLQLDTEHSLFELSNGDNKELWNNVDLMRNQMDADKERLDSNNIEIEFVAGGTVSLTAGVVSWVLRGGTLLSSLLSSVSLFKQFDPLAVVFKDTKKREQNKETGKQDKHEKQVETMFDNRNK
jgi:uncharacterized membrane protein